MSQVLARKWRPKNFSEVVGQEHVVKALANALSSGRLHHAYLFTGTRGVGKTTIARILAKCLNCEIGITAIPCGKCDACVEIDSGRFIDLLEVDAASRTKVEDTRDLLENVQYLPVNGRYKIYLIDEVHMLSGHSFNALLKTLEEPPEHVKFLLATTDPQKLPVTVLSRCLQFNLKILPSELIAKQLSFVLNQEQIAYELPALTLLSQAACGSVRDALSLLDQAISFGNSSVKTPDVRSMLGTTEAIHIAALLEALSKKDVNAILQVIASLADLVVDFGMVLDELLNMLHKIAISQFLQSGDDETVRELASKFSAEEVQLCYQIGLIGKRDLMLAPNSKVGFEMVMLRMLAFLPSSLADASKQQPKQVMAEQQAQIKPGELAENVKQQPVKQAQEIMLSQTAKLTDEQKLQILSKLTVTGTTLALLRCCSIAKFDNNVVEMLLEPSHAPLLNKKHEERLGRAFSDLYNKPISVKISIGPKNLVTLSSKERQGREQKKEMAQDSITKDKNFQKIVAQFDATILPDSFEIDEDS
jgi:DNA polymerase-3 subunit gamma/tau